MNAFTSPEKQCYCFFSFHILLSHSGGSAAISPPRKWLSFFRFYANKLQPWSGAEVRDNGIIPLCSSLPTNSSSLCFPLPLFTFWTYRLPPTSQLCITFYLSLDIAFHPSSSFLFNHPPSSISLSELRCCKSSR